MGRVKQASDEQTLNVFRRMGLNEIVVNGKKKWSLLNPIDYKRLNKEEFTNT